MKKIFPLLFLAAFAANAAAQSGRKNVRPPAQPVPPVQAPVWSPPEPVPPPAARAELGALPESLLQRPIKSLDNSSFRLADFDGKVVVVNLWASWCGPCRSEVPEYEKVRKEYAGRAVEFIGLTTEDPRTSSDRVRQFVRNVNFGFRLGWADRETARTLMNGRRAIPQTLVLGPDGRIVSQWDGYTRGHSGDRLRATIERALSEASLPALSHEIVVTYAEPGCGTENLYEGFRSWNKPLYMFDGRTNANLLALGAKAECQVWFPHPR